MGKDKQGLVQILQVKVLDKGLGVCYKYKGLWVQGVKRKEGCLLREAKTKLGENRRTCRCGLVLCLNGLDFLERRGKNG